VGLFCIQNPGYARDGKKKVQIRGKTELNEYPRIRVTRKKRGKKKSVIPINTFLGKITPGIGCVSQNLEKEAVKHALQKSYRQSAEDIDQKLNKESIRQRILSYGEKAEETENTKKEPTKIATKKLKNPENKKGTYKDSAGGILEKGKQYCEKKIKQWMRRYIMADGVCVYTQLGKWRECKVGVVLRQAGEELFEEGSFCTWERVNTFRNMFEWLLITLFSVKYEMVMISDGALWIRNMREKIPCLKNVKVLWILDWFHLKEHALTLLRVFGLEEGDEKSQEIIEALWRGDIKKAVKKAHSISLSEDEEEREKQLSALQTFKTYLENQKEGIIDYKAYKEEGYLVGSGFMEKRNDTLVKNRMVRQKRMQWGIPGGEAMMRLLTVSMNGRLDELFA